MCSPIPPSFVAIIRCAVNPESLNPGRRKIRTAPLELPGWHACGSVAHAQRRQSVRRMRACHHQEFRGTCGKVMPKKALITGITGQDGSYLAEFLLGKGYEVHGIIRRASTFNTGRLDPIYADPHAARARLFLHYG